MGEVHVQTVDGEWGIIDGKMPLVVYLEQLAQND